MSEYYSVYYWGELIPYDSTNWSTLDLAVKEAEKLALYVGYGCLTRNDMSWVSKNKEYIKIEKNDFYKQGLDRDPNMRGEFWLDKTYDWFK